MIRHAIDSGVNYVDTAYPYHAGRGETVVGMALQDGYRDRVKLATKMPPWIINSQADMDRILDDQLKRLQTGSIDFYLLHGLDKHTWPKLSDLKVLAWAERAMKDGRIGRLGFSFHDEYALFKQIVDAYDGWAMCLIQHNYMDTKYQAGSKGLQYADNKGLAVVIMEPLRGGSLSKLPPPPEVAKVWAEAAVKRSPAEWALLWVWEQPGVSLLLSGMSSMLQLKENLEVAGRSGPGVLTPEDMAVIERVRQAYKKLSPVPCTNCSYCMPCKNGVEIPHIFQIYSDGVMYDDMRTARFFYRGPTGLRADQRADQCLECGECEEKCPQKIEIAAWLKKVHSELGPRK
jgi:predicted aldo/keto reductase-like oxidoreductase